MSVVNSFPNAKEPRKVLAGGADDSSSSLYLWSLSTCCSKYCPKCFIGVKFLRTHKTCEGGASVLVLQMRKLSFRKLNLTKATLGSDRESKPGSPASDPELLITEVCLGILELGRAAQSLTETKHPACCVSATCLMPSLTN